MEQKEQESDDNENVDLITTECIDKSNWNRKSKTKKKKQSQV